MRVADGGVRGVVARLHVGRAFFEPGCGKDLGVYSAHIFAEEVSARRGVVIVVNDDGGRRDGRK